MYDIKKIVREIGNSEGTETPSVRIDLVMDCVSEDKQYKVEQALKGFIKTVQGIMSATTDTTP